MRRAPRAGRFVRKRESRINAERGIKAAKSEIGSLSGERDLLAKGRIFLTFEEGYGEASVMTQAGKA